MYAFCVPTCKDDFFVLRGAAGTGKTTILKNLTAHLQGLSVSYRLATPTARAAKILSAKTEESASTIHSMIYRPESVKDEPRVILNLRSMEEEAYTVFIIDEASMVSDVLNSNDRFETSRPLLTDLIDYAKSGNDRNKLIFIGDPCQLPPVGSEDSPALNSQYLSTRFGQTGQVAELTKVLRQKPDSYLYQNAVNLRRMVLLKQNPGYQAINFRAFSNEEEAVKAYIQQFDREKLDKIVMIGLGNGTVQSLNEQARNRLGLSGQALSVGDLVVLDATCYPEPELMLVGDQTLLVQRPAFYRGETGLVREVFGRVEEFGGLHFQRIRVELSDGQGKPLFLEKLALLEVLQTEKGQLDYEDEKRLYAAAVKRDPNLAKAAMPFNDPYLGAMRLRYGYALTCHKAQGGEWDRVILHPKYFRDARWMYTAVTRAREELYSWNRW